MSARLTRPGRVVASVAAAAIIALLFLSQGITAPFSKDQEPQAAGWLRDMVVHHHWLVARDPYGYMDRKPPLYYWLSALAVEASGGRVGEANARAVSLVAGAALAAEVMGWSAAMLGGGEGWLAFAFLLGSYGFASRATEVLTDMLLSFLLFSAWCVLYPQLEGQGSSARAVAAGAILGLAVLTKGPVALVLIALAALIYLLVMRRNPMDTLRRSWPWLMGAVAIAIGLCWYVPAMVSGGREFRTIVMQENLGHFLPGALGGTGEAARPFYYIALRTLGGALPMSILAAALIAALAGRTWSSEARKPLLFQLALVAAVLLLFSIASAKRDDYILPAMPGLAIAFAALFTLRAEVPNHADYAARIADWTAGAIGFASVLAVVAGLGAARFMRAATLPFHMQSSDAAYAAIFARGLSQMEAPFAIFLVALAIGALAVFAGLYRRRPTVTGGGVAIVALAGVAIFVGTLRSELSRTRTLKGFAAEAHRAIGHAPLYGLEDTNYELSFYYGRSVPAWQPRSVKSGTRAEPVYVAATPRQLAGLKQATRTRLRLVLQGHNAGAEGSYSLYEYDSPTSSGEGR